MLEHDALRASLLLFAWCEQHLNYVMPTSIRKANPKTFWHSVPDLKPQLAFAILPIPPLHWSRSPPVGSGCFAASLIPPLDRSMLPPIGSGCFATSSGFFAVPPILPMNIAPSVNWINGRAVFAQHLFKHTVSEEVCLVVLLTSRQELSHGRWVVRFM